MEDSMEKWLKTKQQSVDSMSICNPGDIVGDWKILALLGKGGSAEVYRVEHVVSKQIGALKLLSRQDETSRKRFIQERDLLQAQKISCFARFCAAKSAPNKLNAANVQKSFLAFILFSSMADFLLRLSYFDSRSIIKKFLSVKKN